MKSRSAKNKGAKFQDDMAKAFAEAFHLEFGTDKDLKGRPMGQSGTDIVMSKLAKQKIPFDIECKKQETWSIPSWWNQTIANTETNRIPLLLVSKNRTEPLAVLKVSDLIKLFIEDKQYKEVCNKCNDTVVISEIKSKIMDILDNL